jgi:prophage regulatory protein
MIQRILRRRDLRAHTGLGATRLNEFVEAGTFPKPIKLGERAIGWLESEIAEWQAKRIAERDQEAV